MDGHFELITKWLKEITHYTTVKTIDDLIREFRAKEIRRQTLNPEKLKLSNFNFLKYTRNERNFKETYVFDDEKNIRLSLCTMEICMHHFLHIKKPSNYEKIQFKKETVKDLRPTKTSSDHAEKISKNLRSIVGPRAKELQLKRREFVNRIKSNVNFFDSNSAL